MRHKHDVITKRYYEVVTVMPGRTPDRIPNGWNKYIRGPLPGTAEASPLGLLLRIEAADMPEAFRLKRLIHQHHERWARTEGQGVREVQVFEVDLIKKGRVVDASELSGVSDISDSANKRLFSLANGVALTSDMVEEDQRLAEAHRVRVELLADQYATATKALQAGQQREYQEAQASGETRAFWEWARTQPHLPPFEEWSRAMEAGEEPQLLLLAPEPTPAVVDPERLAKEQAEAEAEAMAVAQEQERRDEARRAVLQQEFDAWEEREMAEIASSEITEEQRQQMVQEEEERRAALVIEVRYIFEEHHEPDQTLDGVVTLVREMSGRFRFVQPDEVRQVLVQLIAEGVVREDEAGFHTTQEGW